MTKLILVAEDSPFLRNTVTKCLLDAGFNVVPTCDGEEALEIIRSSEKSFDAVLADHEMPKIGGIMLAQCVRRMDKYKEIPIFIMSASRDELAKATAKRVGVTAWIEKDYTFATALRVMQTALAK